jgi:hypothetical protein
LRTSKFWPAATLVAVACAAYLAADVAHEALGHGGACLALGGKLILLSTTYADCSVRSRLIDGAGPVVGIAVALLAWAWLRFATPRSQASRASQASRVFLCLVFAFAIFWNVGYMMKSGLTDQGDWAFVINGLEPSFAWHAALTVLGLVLYIVAMRMLTAAIVATLPAGEAAGWRPLAFALTAYLTAGLLSAAGAFFDPRGPSTILTDALPSSLGAIGLVWVGWVMNKRRPDFRIAAPTSLVWMAAGVASAAVFIAVLGPGLRF